MSTDAVRAALAELVACHTEEAGLTMSMVANRADFDAFMERCDQRLAAALDAARAALSEPAPGVAVPDGWQLVPKEPTREMLDAYVNTLGRFSSARADWAAMLAAAPTTQEPTP